jgi:MFS family permease
VRAGRQRETFRNRDVLAFTASYLLAVLAEWSVFIGVLVYAHDRGGARAAGLASIAVIVPYVIGAPIASAVAGRFRPARVRIVGLGVQSIGYSAAAAAAWADAPTAAVVAGVMVAIVAATTLRPAGAALLPAIVRTSRELTVSNLWQSYCENASDIAGPLLATLLLFVGGPAAALAGCAASVILATVVASLLRSVDPPAGSEHDELRGAGLLRRQISAMRGHSGVVGVLAVEGGQYLIVGAFDIILVVIAAEQLDMGDAGAGVLNTAFGIGALVSTFVATALARRRRVAPYLTAGLAVMAVSSIVVGSVMTLVVALVLLPVIGLALSTINMLAQLLLQRSGPPEQLAAIFSVIELTCGVGLIVGSLVAQVLIAVAGPEVALVGIGVAMVVLMLATAGSLRHADSDADVPVVAMSLLRRVPVFSPLPRLELEAVARSACELRTAPAESVVTQGDHGDRFYAIADGDFDVTIDERLVRTLSRGGSFGEIALLADVPRTATVTSRGDGALLVIERVPFLVAVTGHDSSRQAAWGAIRTMRSTVPIPDDIDQPSTDATRSDSAKSDSNGGGVA